MPVYEQQLMAKYRQAGLLAEANEARLARMAQRKPRVDRVRAAHAPSRFAALAARVLPGRVSIPNVTPRASVAAGGSVSGHLSLSRARPL